LARSAGVENRRSEITALTHREDLISYMETEPFAIMKAQKIRTIAVAKAAKAIGDGRGINELLAAAYNLERYITTGCAPEE
jgi:hypothetical protein